MSDELKGPRWITAAEAVGDFEFLSANIARVDASGNDSTGIVGDLSNPFLTVQAAINAIESLDPIPDWPLIEIGNFDNNFEEITTSLRTLAIRGTLSQNGVVFSSGLPRPFLLLTFTEPDANVSLILENIYSPSCDVVVNNGPHNFKVQLLNTYISAILADGSGDVPGIGNTGQVIVDGGGNSYVSAPITCLGSCDVSNFYNPVTVKVGDGSSIRAINCNLGGAGSNPGDNPPDELHLTNSFITAGNLAAVTTIEAQDLLIKPPTSDPLIEGVLWNDSGTPTISAGPPP